MESSPVPRQRHELRLSHDNNWRFTQEINNGNCVNRFFKHAILEDGLLLVKAYNPKLLGETSRIVIPQTYLPTALTSLHTKANHPTKHQM